MSFFFTVQNLNTSVSHWNSNLSKISKWEFPWKMSLNSDPSKQAQELIFSSKLQKICHPSIHFNNKSVKQVPSRKHLDMNLDTKLNFQEHLKNILNKVNKIIGLLRKLQNILAHGPLQNRLSDFILITVMLFMIDITIIASTKN